MGKETNGKACAAGLDSRDVECEKRRMVSAAEVASRFGVGLCIMSYFLPSGYKYSTVLRIMDSKNLPRDDSTWGHCPYNEKKIIA